MPKDSGSYRPEKKSQGERGPKQESPSYDFERGGSPSRGSYDFERGGSPSRKGYDSGGNSSDQGGYDSGSASSDRRGRLAPSKEGWVPRRSPSVDPSVQPWSKETGTSYSEQSGDQIPPQIHMERFQSANYNTIRSSQSDLRESKTLIQEFQNLPLSSLTEQKLTDYHQNFSKLNDKLTANNDKLTGYNAIYKELHPTDEAAQTQENNQQIYDNKRQISKNSREMNNIGKEVDIMRKAFSTEDTFMSENDRW